MRRETRLGVGWLGTELSTALLLLVGVRRETTRPMLSSRSSVEILGLRARFCEAPRVASMLSSAVSRDQRHAKDKMGY